MYKALAESDKTVGNTTDNNKKTYRRMKRIKSSYEYDAKNTAAQLRPIALTIML